MRSGGGRVSDPDLSETSQAGAVKARWGWALWEFATTPYLILIVVYVFGPYYARTIIGDEETGLVAWGSLQTMAGFAIAVCAPIAGSVVDRIGPRKPATLLFTAGMIPLLLLLWLAKPDGEGGLSLTMINATVIALSICFEFAMVFHNAMLPSLGPRTSIGSASGLGMALGSLGSFLLLMILLLGFTVPEEPLLGISHDDNGHYRIIGPLIALWAVIFTIPFALWTPDVKSKGVAIHSAIRSGFVSMRLLLRFLFREERNIGIFLIARMFYNDGISAIVVFAGVYAAELFDWDLIDILIYAGFAIAAGVIGGLAGIAAEKQLGAKRATLSFLLLIIVAGAVCLSVSSTHILFFVPLNEAALNASPFPVFSTVPELIYLGGGIGVSIAISASYATSRTLMARITPEDRRGECFGLYALSGKATAFVAPLVVTLIASATDNEKLAVSSILIFLLVGFVLLAFAVRERVPAPASSRSSV